METQKNTIDISIVIPAHNEEKCIESSIRELYDVLKGMPERSEIIIINDGSEDDTFCCLKKLQNEIPHLSIVKLTPNVGQSAALGVGFRHARGKIIVTMDADGQNYPADIPRLIIEMDNRMSLYLQIKSRGPFSTYD